MRDGLEQVILAGNGLAGIEQGELAARRMTDLKGALIEVARARPQAVGTRPIAGPMYTRAAVAGDRNPSNLPVTVSIDPLRTAIAEPVPAIVLRMATSIGTGASRTL